MNKTLDDFLHKDNEPTPNKDYDKLINDKKVSIDYLRNIFPNTPISNDDVIKINKIIDNEEEDINLFLQNIINYRHLIENEDCSLLDFINAIKFCSYQNIGLTPTQSYEKTFSYDSSIQQLVLSSNMKDKQSLELKAMSYAKSKLVLKITQASDIPFNLLFQGIRQKAIFMLKHIAETASSDKNKILALSKLLEHTAPQENININLNLDSKKEESPIDKYKKALEKLSNDQVKLIENNETHKSEIINVEIFDKED